MGTIASSNAQEKKKKKISPMPSCLHRYTFLQCSLFPFFDEPSSLFILHKSPQSSQNSSSASFSVSLMETIMVFFFFFGSKTLAEHYIVTVQWLLLYSSSFFFLGQKLLQSITLSLCSGCSFLLPLLLFFGQKNFIEALIAEMKFSPKIIQNIDASSTFDRMLWLKLQQW